MPNYPTSNGRYICYDKFGNNQVETFNTGKIPDDFIYPETCYDHFYDSGEDIVINKTDKVNSQQSFFTIDRISYEYDILYDYNFYHPLTIGSQETMAQKIINTDGKFVIDSDILPYIYLDMETNYINAPHLNVMTNPPTQLNNLPNPTGNQYSLATDNMVVINLNFYTSIGPMTSSYFYEGGQLIIKYDSAVITPTTSFLYLL